MHTHADTRCLGPSSLLRIGAGLEKGTGDKYRAEWMLYIRFCSNRGITPVPGRDRPWRIDVVARYLQWRANRNNSRSIAQIKSKLKHCSLCHGHLLPTRATEGPAKLRIQLAMVSKVLAKRQKKSLKAAGKPTGPKRSLALGRVAVGLLFSAYGAVGKSSFIALEEPIQRMLVRCPSMHTGCMRFGLVRDLWRQASLRWSDVDSTYRLASDWRKMKRGGAYTIPFPAKPGTLAMSYPIFSRAGVEVGSFTAADVLSWRSAAVGSRRGRRIFGSRSVGMPSRKVFQSFLRESFRRLLVGPPEEIAALILAITPHSFRAGMASDLHRMGTPVKAIMKVGRWESERAMSQYIRDGLAQRLSAAKYSSLRKAAANISKWITIRCSAGRTRAATKHFSDSGSSS